MSQSRELDFAEAIREAIRQEMARDNTVFVLGEDVGKFGGIFGCTKGLQEEFGESRVLDTPISETAIVGAAIGAAITGMHPIAEVEFMDFRLATGTAEDISDCVKDTERMTLIDRNVG